MDQIEQRDSTLLDEEWRDAVGWEDRYQVSSLGRVRSKDWQVTTVREIRGILQSFTWTSKGKLMKFNQIEGYPSVSLTRDGVSQNVLVHRLVAKTFLPNPNNLPFVNHKDTNRSNNKLENLKWCTEEYNNIHAVYHGCNLQAISVICIETSQKFPSIARACAELANSRSYKKLEDGSYICKGFHLEASQ